MSSLITTAGTAVGDFTGIPTEQLKRELADAIGITARTLSRLAAIWHELENRGEDLSDLRGGLMAYLPAIAAGNLDPEIVVRCAGQAMLIRAAGALPLARQREILDRGVPMITLVDGSSLKEERKPIERLNSHEVRRVFVGSTVRSPVEQAKLLAPSVDRKPAKATRLVIMKVRLTQEEYDAVRAKASQAGQQAQTFARDIIMNATKG